jgi:hypothetical protein
MFANAAILLQDPSMARPPEQITVGAVLLFYAALIYLVSGGRYWAGLIYAVLLGVRTVFAIRYASPGLLMLIRAISFVCEYMAVYWLFTQPGRRWFKN